jgi:rSAM/selenodomain-associated transferase 1
MTDAFCLLVVAKAPVPGFAKTRLCPPATPAEAAEIAAAALLDTLDAVAATPGAVPVVAATGEFAAAARSAELAHALWPMTVIRQRGEGFAQRLANAHQDAAVPGLPVLQIGMDTPQVTPDLLAKAAALLTSEHDAVLGPADDGGWWALGLGNPTAASVLAGIPMSRADTGERTLRALTEAGLRTTKLDQLSDVDTMDDAERVASVCGGRFAKAVAAVLS